MLSSAVNIGTRSRISGSNPITAGLVSFHVYGPHAHPARKVLEKQVALNGLQSWKPGSDTRT